MKKKVIAILALIILALVSFKIVGDFATSVETGINKHSIAQMDDKIDTVMKLTAGTTAASATLTLLPDDNCTPIANQLAELSKYFLLILSSLYFEKYMLTTVSWVAFKLLIPVACLLGIPYIWFGLQWCKKFAIKLAVLALAFALVIPTSVVVTDLIYNTHSASIEKTIKESENIVNESEDAGGVDNLVDWITNKTANTVDYVKNILGQFIDALAIMLVTCCVIPIIVMLAYIGIVKLAFTAGNNPATSKEIEKYFDKHLLEKKSKSDKEE